jgi:hypothetical protein
MSDKTKELCDYVMRQTDYTEEYAIKKLTQHDMDVEIIIKEWMGINNKKNCNRSNNQKIFDEFRKFLDDASTNYYSTKKN